MIRIFLGNIGSGKTISSVMEIYNNESDPNGLHTFSNIKTKNKGKYKITKNHLLNGEMFIKKEVVKIKKSGEIVYKKVFNKDFWLKQREKYEGLNIVIDEAHTLINSRSSTSRNNIIMNEFLSLARKIVSDPNKDATLTLISQLHNRIDTVARQQATEVRYHICYYEKVCRRCRRYWTETSDLSDFRKLKKCPHCHATNPIKLNHRVLVYIFESMDDYIKFKDYNCKSYIAKLKIKNISKYFPYYDTLQMEELISDD